MTHFNKQTKDRPNVQIISFTGKDIRNLIPEIARLRIEIFKEYPFLYIGDYEYEMRYLNKFLTMSDAIVIAAFDKDVLVGLSTGFPFSYESEKLKNVFISNHRNPQEYFCLGESVLNKAYRGLGIGKAFYDYRESHAQKLNCYPYICFYTIVRANNDPRRPIDYRPLAPFWKSQGYVEHSELIGTLSYQEIGETEETPKEMVFWIKETQKKS